MTVSSVVLVAGHDVPYDLDWVSLSHHEDGSLLLQLKLGMAYDTHGLAVSDREPGRWSLLALDNLLIGREEVYVMEREVTFDLSPVRIEVPAGAAAVTLLEPSSGGPVSVREIRARATRKPFACEVIIVLEGGRELVFGTQGWTLRGPGAAAGTTRVRLEADVEVKAEDPAAVPFPMPRTRPDE